MNHLPFACLIAALVVFALATLNVPARPNLTALGLFFVTMAAVLGRFALVGLAILALSGCATRQLDVTGLSKEQVQLERERITEAREVRKERWWAFAESAGKAGLSLGTSWLRAKFIDADDSGFRK